MMKILPVSSGKGGVGKTTFALNLALTLSRNYSVVLVDLDSGTSSVRNFMKMKVKKDLYHFLKKDFPINNCLTGLNSDLDPENEFKNFHFLASPKDYIYDIINYSSEIERKLINGINSLQADYVILDLRAGIDHNILKFIPYDNSGLLVFTPKVEASSFTATEIVKASVLRVFRLIRHNGKFCISNFGIDDKEIKHIDSILRKVEDSYDKEDSSIIRIIRDLQQKYKNSRILPGLSDFINDYKIYYILNHFNSVNESIRKVISPFITNISNKVSESISLKSLGWIAYHSEILQSSQYQIPYFLFQFYKQAQEQEKNDQIEDDLRKMMGLDVAKSVKGDQKERNVKPEDVISDQLNLLKSMYTDGKSQDPVNNFRFIKKTILSMNSSSIHNLGMIKLLNAREILQKFFEKYMS
jgi:MinD-like ATPase involved in chromosome partitioning or flagellar assembly